MKVAFYKYTGHSGISGLFDKLVRTVTKGPYSHCELIFPDGIAYGSSLQDGGCRFKQIVFDQDKWDFIELPKLSPACISWIERFCIAELGSPYDFPGVFRFLLPRIRESKQSWFCSEIVCAALQEGGLLLGINAWQVHPSKLYELLNGR